MPTAAAFGFWPKFSKVVPERLDGLRLIVTTINSNDSVEILPAEALPAFE
jgi:hypothetical protein